MVSAVMSAADRTASATSSMRDMPLDGGCMGKVAIPVSKLYPFDFPVQKSRAYARRMEAMEVICPRSGSESVRPREVKVSFYEGMPMLQIYVDLSQATAAERNALRPSDILLVAKTALDVNGIVPHVSVVFTNEQVIEPGRMLTTVMSAGASPGATGRANDASPESSPVAAAPNSGTGENGPLARYGHLPGRLVDRIFTRTKK
jgi:hypothetical protein